MGQTTVAQFATELGLPTALLLEQLKSAGVTKSVSEDGLTEDDKTSLLTYLRKEHGAEAAPKNKITLTRKINSEIKKTDSSGRARTIQVEVRKKRVLESLDAPAEFDAESVAEDVIEAPVAAEVTPDVFVAPIEEPVAEVVVEAPVAIVQQPLVQQPVAEVVVAVPEVSDRETVRAARKKYAKALKNER